MTRLRDLAVGVFGLLAFAYLAVPAIDPDYGWHVANGRHLLDGVLFAGLDVYSWTARGAAWIAHEWLTEGVMAFLNDSLGPTANSLLCAGLAAAALILTVTRLERRRFGTVVALVAGVITLLDVGTLVSVGPAAVEVLGAAWLLWLVDAWRSRPDEVAGPRGSASIGGRAFGIAVLLTMLAWANAHGSFVLGLGILGASWLGLASERGVRDARARTMLAVGVGGALVTLLNPFGLRLIAYVLSAQTGSRLRLITEWQPPSLADRMWWAFAAALVLAAIGGGAWILRSVRRRPASEAGVTDLPAAHDTGAPATGGGADPTARAAAGVVRLDDVLLAVAVGVAGLLHARHAGVFGIAAAPAIAAGVAWCGRFAPASVSARLRSRAPMRSARLANLAVLALVSVMVAGLAWARVGPSNTAAAVRSTYPVDALPALDEVAATSGTGLCLFNDYAWGGWLEMTRPAIPVFIDGRSEVYGDAQLARYALIASGQPGWPAALADAGVNALLIRTGSPLASALSSSGWLVIHVDPVATIATRNQHADGLESGLAMGLTTRPACRR